MSIWVRGEFMFVLEYYYGIRVAAHSVEKIGEDARYRND